MRLLFVHQYLGAHGGAEANILITAQELQARGHCAALLHASVTGRGEDAWRDTFSPNFRLPEVAPVERAKAVLAEFEPDLIYLHNLADLDVMGALLDSGIPVIRMVHDHAMYCMRGYKYNPLTRAICERPASLHCVFPCLACLGRSREGTLPVRWNSYRSKKKEIRLNQRCDAMVVYSEYSKRELIRNGFEAERIYTHVPIDCWGTSGPVSSLGDQNRLLFVGQIIRGKGVDLLLKALAKVKARFECLIIGDGSHLPYCERLSASLGLTNRVQFGGYVPHQQLKDFYLDTSVFVVSSVWPEPFGLVGPEAMRYGLPVVAFDAGGIREWLTDGENGFLVPWMDTDIFAARIEALLADKELARRMGRRGLERVNRDYSSGRQIDRLETLFLRLLEETQARDGETKETNYTYGLCASN